MSCFTVISANGCKWCELAVEELRSLREEFEVLKIEDRPALKRLFKMAGFTQVPQIFSPEGDHIGGYHELRAFLKGEP
jgi:glutaredoxin